VQPHQLVNAGTRLGKIAASNLVTLATWRKIFEQQQKVVGFAIALNEVALWRVHI